MKQRLDKLESENSIDSDNAKLLNDAAERLKALSEAVKKEK